MIASTFSSAKVSSDIVDLYPEPVKGAEVEFSYANCQRLTGVEIPKERIKAILTSLDIQISSENEAGLRLSVPAYRNDVTREADVIEEVLRIYGYNKVPLPEQLRTSITFSNGADREAYRDKVSALLSANGFSEMMSNSLTNASYFEHSTSVDKSRMVEMLNPLSSELNVMRQTLLFGGLTSIEHNINRQQRDLKFYEFGKVYFKDEGYTEGWRLGLFLTGNRALERWNSESEPADAYDLKGTVEQIVQHLGIKTPKIETSNSDFFQSGIDLTLKGRTIGTAGAVNNKLREKFDIEQDVLYAELDWDTLIELAEKNTPEFSEIPKYPTARRDLSLLLDEGVQFAQIETIARQQEQNLLQKVDLFDVYEGKNLPSGKKSYAVSFVLQDKKATLTDEKVDAIIGKVRSALKDQLGAQLR